MLKAEEIERSKDRPAQLRIESPSNLPAGERATELRTDRHESPSVKPIDPAKRSGATAANADRGARTVRKQRVRWALFALLPIAAVAGAYWYVTGGQVMSTDDAYVEADKVGISTDISGIVQDVDVRDNQHVAAGKVLYRLDPRQFQIALDNAKANLGADRADDRRDEAGLPAHAQRCCRRAGDRSRSIRSPYDRKPRCCLPARRQGDVTIRRSSRCSNRQEQACSRCSSRRRRNWHGLPAMPIS